MTGVQTYQIGRDRKSTRLNSSHTIISYAVFCLKKSSTRRAARSRLSPQVPPSSNAGCLPPVSVPPPRLHPSNRRGFTPAGVTPAVFFFNDGAPPEISPLPFPHAFQS